MDAASSRTVLYDFGRDQYTAACVAVLGAPGELRYGGAKDRTVPADDKYWARLSRTVVDEYQETLRLGVRRWCHTGLLFVQMFAPITDSRASDNLDKLAELVRNAFRTYQPAEIEFTKAAITDNLPAETAWQRINVTATYQFRQFI